MKAYTQQASRTVRHKLHGFNQSNALLESSMDLLQSPFRTLSFLFLLTILFVLMIGIWVMDQNVQRAQHSWANSPKVILYLTVGMPEKKAQALLEQIQTRTDVYKAVYISSQAGLKELMQQLKLTDSVAQLPTNVLPAVIQIQPGLSLTSMDNFIALSESFRAFPEVTAIEINKEFAKQYYAYRVFWQKIIFWLEVLLPLLIFFSLFNIMRVILLSKPTLTGHFALMERCSLFYTGGIIGFLSALLAWGLYELVWISWRGVIQAGMIEPLIDLQGVTIIKLLAMGLCLGVFSAWLATARFLRPI